MISFQDFIIKWNGKYIDFDGVYGPQCFDLLHQFVVEVLGLTDGRILAAPAAKDIYNNYDNLYGHENFEKIANTPTGIPGEGDIVIWSSGQYGHVAIFIEGNANTFRSFDQNYPTGSPCHVQEHTYGYCLGWLHFKGNLPPADLIAKQSDAFIAVCEKLGLPADKDIVLADIDKLIKYETIVIEKDKQITVANQQIEELQGELSRLKDQFLGLQFDNESLKVKVGEQEKTIEVSTKQVEDLQNELSGLQEQTNKPIVTGWRKFLIDLIFKF